MDKQTKSDNEYDLIFTYQDHLTKCIIFKPLKIKTAEGFPYTLYSVLF